MRTGGGESLRHRFKAFETGPIAGRQPELAMSGMRLAGGRLTWEVQDNQRFFYLHIKVAIKVCTNCPFNFFVFYYFKNNQSGNYSIEIIVRFFLLIL